MTTTTDLWRPTPGAVGDLEAWIEFGPAHYCMGQAHACRACDAGKTGNHGRGSGHMRWYLRGPDLVTQFVIHTGWYHSVDPFHNGGSGLGATPADLGFHSPRPWYGNQPQRGGCSLLSIDNCYYDGSGSAADIGFRLLTDQGDQAVWEWMHLHFVGMLEDRDRHDKDPQP